MSDLAWRFYGWMCKPSKLKGLAWRFFFWITPRRLSEKFQGYLLRSYVERYPGEIERRIRESLPVAARRIREEMARQLLNLDAQQVWQTPSEEELAALGKEMLDRWLHPEAYKGRFEKIGPHP